MEVKLFDYTGKETTDPADYAMTRLIFTKSTRLNMSPGLLNEIRAWPTQKKIDEIKYMANTVPSSWEFCDYSFIITGVTRAFTHQLVRTRTASYAQQAMRVLNVSEGLGWEYATGPTIERKSSAKAKYDAGMRMIAQVYRDLIADGVAIQDARGILPTNILTNICMKINMRNFVDLAKKRSSARVQDEYRSVIEAMKAEVLRVHPFTTIFMERTADVAALELQEMIMNNVHIAEDTKTFMIKKLDRIRAEA